MFIFVKAFMFKHKKRKEKTVLLTTQINNRQMKKHFLAIIISCFSLLNYAQITTEQLQKNIVSFSKDDNLKHASWSICVRDASTTQIVAQYNADQMLLAASTIKTLSTAIALDLLGSNFNFTTSLAYSGEIDEKGVLNGNIYIIGGGDPSFGSSSFGKNCSVENIYLKFYNAIMEAGIQEVKGNIIADASIFDNHIAPVKWQWEDIGNYYGAGCSGLNNNENMYAVYFSSGKNLGDAASIVEVDPKIYEMKLINEVTTSFAHSGDNVYIYGAPFCNTRILTGTIPSGKTRFKVKGSIPDPAFFTANQFYQYLNNKGMQISGKAMTQRQINLNNTGIKTEEEKSIIANHFSPSLFEIIKQTNLYSNNMFAETLFKYLGYHKKEYGSAENAIKVIEEYFQNLSIDTKALRIVDGSGLSRYNSISSSVLSHFLAEYSLKESFEDFYQSLPIAGKSGTLKNMFSGSIAVDNIHAKSGTMSKVRAYAGYVEGKTGKRYTFAFIINNFEGSSIQMRKKMEKIMINIAELE